MLGPEKQALKQENWLDENDEWNKNSSYEISSEQIEEVED